MAHGFNINEVNIRISLSNIGRLVLDKGTSVVTFTATTAAAAMFPNADDHLSNWVENLSWYNKDNLV